jgi:hypothetical protein
MCVRSVKTLTGKEITLDIEPYFDVISFSFLFLRWLQEELLGKLTRSPPR